MLLHFFLALISSSFSLSSAYLYSHLANFFSSLSQDILTLIVLIEPRLRLFSYHYYTSPGGPSIIAAIVPEATTLNDLFRKFRERIGRTKGLSRDNVNNAVIFFFTRALHISNMQRHFFKFFPDNVKPGGNRKNLWDEKKFSSLILVFGIA